MTQAPSIKEAPSASPENWKIDQQPSVLSHIHDGTVNIAIYERDISPLTREINQLLNQNIELRVSGDLETITAKLTQSIPPTIFPLVTQDIKELLHHFSAVTQTSVFRVLLATINTNMCRKFHTDINDVRLLCTYSGPGTLWLTQDNINQAALDSCGHNGCIAIDENRIQQVNTGAVALLKGAIYPQKTTRAVVHRSPTIEESGTKRLLLRIDTNETMNFWG